MYILDYKISKYQYKYRDYLFKCYIDYLSLFPEIKLTKNKLNKIKQTVSCFILNVSKPIVFNQDTITLVLDNTVYSRRLIFDGRDVNRKISIKEHRPFLSWLDREGFISLKVGGVESYKMKNGIWVVDKTSCSSITLKAKLKDIFESIGGEDSKKLTRSDLPLIKDNVILKDKRKKKITYKMTPHIKNMINGVKEMNTVNSGSIISLNGKDFDVQGSKIFNNSSFKDGGRTYLMGDYNIQGLPKELRNQITINGEPVVEVDYSALHPSIVAEIEGENLNGNDPYGIQIAGYNVQVLRKIAKLALIIMFNVQEDTIQRGLNSASQALRTEIMKNPKLSPRTLFMEGKIPKETIDTKEILGALMERNYFAGDWFFQGKGLVLQHVDSNMMDFIIAHFTQRGEVAIPIHDSVIVRESLKEECYKVMKEAYHTVLGSTTNCRLSEN